jgi:hypothetical protein
MFRLNPVRAAIYEAEPVKARGVGYLRPYRSCRYIRQPNGGLRRRRAGSVTHDAGEIALVHLCASKGQRGQDAYQKKYLRHGYLR